MVALVVTRNDKFVRPEKLNLGVMRTNFPSSHCDWPIVVLSSEQQPVVGGTHQMSRVTVVVAALLVAGTSAAEELNAEAAQEFVVGQLFAFRCFEGTHGTGRVYSDGSVAGTVQFGGRGPIRSVVLPPGTVRVQNEAVCASVSGIPFQPCFTVDKTDPQSFRGSISGLRFAYCDFTRGDAARTHITQGLRAPAPNHLGGM
jgi:hypothetical protein